MNRIILLLCVAVGLFFAASSAFACSCGHPSPEQYLAGAKLIFRGTVLAVDTEAKPTRGNMRAKFKVAVSFKGLQSDEVEVSYTARQGRGANCGWQFSVGQEVTVFADGNRSIGFSTSYCAMIPWTSDSTGRFLDAITQYRALREGFITALREKGLDANLLREQADLYLKYRDDDDAEMALSQLLTILPRDVAALIDRAELRYDSARFEQALADYRAAIALDARNVAARRGQTFTLIKLGRMGELGPSDKDFTGFSNAEGKPVSFAGMDLRGANFRNAKLYGVDFTGADLRKADFSGANLSKCKFAGAKLARANFRDLNGAYNTTFQGAGLEYANFTGVNLFFAEFNGAVLDHANFSKTRLDSSSIQNASISNTVFRGASLSYTNLRGTTWDGQDLSDVDLHGSDLRDTVFRNTNLRGAIFGDSNYSNAIVDLRGADLSGADLGNVVWGPALFDCRTRFPKGLDLATLPLLPLWSNCPGQPPKVAAQSGYPFQKGPRLNKIDAPGALLSHINLTGFGFWQVQFGGSDFSESKLVEIDIQGGSYTKTNFEHAQLNRAWISNASFSEASFEHADLSGAKLRGVDFSSARFKGANLNDLCFDQKTLWPKGFDPRAAGAKACQ